MTTVAILGTGRVGRALGERLVHAGVNLRYGARHPEPAASALTGPLAGIPTRLPAEAVADAEIVLLAVPAAAAMEAARSAGSLDGKILLDCTNSLRRDGGGPTWAPPPEGSMAQALAAAFPGATVIKGFNHFSSEIMRSPELVSGPAEAFFAGDDAGAKAQVMELAGKMGFRPHDAGTLRNASLIENLAVLWINLAMTEGAGRQFAFRLERQA
jgi:8-hydroxy-5-deazaflavin:NADPH oxidoreductase